MNSSKFSILGSFFVLAFVISVNFAFGANTPAPQAILVADVNIKDAKIVSQKGNDFNIAFSLTNGTGLQTGVKYGIELVPDGGKFVADVKVYDESLTLYENSTIKKEITYTAPAVLSGNYTLYIASNNESSFPFSKISLGKVKLSSSVKGVQILNDSCYLQKDGDKDITHYTLMQNVSVSSGQTLKLTCSAMNGAGTDMILTPSFDTRYFTAYGKEASQSGGDSTPITFSKNEKKTFSVFLPKVSASGFYNLEVGLGNSNFSSNNVSLHYAVSGLSATISKISLDKDYYQRGEKGEISLIWFTSGGNLREDGITPIAPKVSLEASITDGSGRMCADKIKQPLFTDFKNPITTIPFEVKSDCPNPQVSATILDENGNSLEQKDFAFKSTTENQNISKKSRTKSTVTTIVLIALLIIVGFVIYIKKKKGPSVNI